MMRKQSWFRFTLFVLAILLVLAACRREEEALPTPAPTAIVTDPVSTPDGETAAATPTPKPTERPGPVTGVDPDDIDWPPQVVYTSPVAGDEVALDGAITVRFDQPMDQESVAGALSIAAADDGTAVLGGYSWPRPDTVIFTPRSDLKRRQRYRVRIADSAQGQNGLSLPDSVEWQVQTVGFLEVSQAIPAAGVDGVQTDAAITVLFNRPVVPLVSSGDQADLPRPLTLDPPVDGEGEWVSTSIYRFTPDEPLAGATTYRATVAAGLEDVTGGVLADDFSWQFTTLQPSVVSFEPANGAEQIPPTQPMTITFNMPMDRASTETAVSLRSEGDVPPLTYEWSEEDRVLTLAPDTLLDMETSYQIVVDEAARAASGEASLDRQTVAGFDTVPLPAVASTEPGRGETAAPWQRGVSIRFTAPMDWDTLDGRIQIEPEPERVRYNPSGPMGQDLYLDFNLDLNTRYTVTIPGDAADPYGNTLGVDYTWSFTMSSGEPVASFNLPGSVSQLSTGFTTQVELLHRNISQADVALYEVGLPLNLVNDPYNLQDYRPSIEPLRTWSLTAESSQEEVGVLPIPLADEGTLPTGIYLLTATAPELSDDSRYWQIQRALVVVADTNIVVKEMVEEVHVWVTDLATGEPVSGRDLVLYNNQGVEIETAVSDNDGFARFDRPPVDYLNGVTVVSNQPGAVGFGVGRSEWNPGVMPWDFGLPTRLGPEPELFGYIYTDRPIYRPGDTIFFKGIVRDANYGRYALPTVEKVGLRIFPEFFFEDGGLEEAFTVTMDELGAFTGEFQLPEDVALGTYQLSMSGQEFEAGRRFSVAEYRKPEFLITMTPEQPELLRGQATAVTLAAEFFAGGPVTDAPVQWTVYEDNFRPDVPGRYYSFGDSGRFFYEASGPLAGFGGGGSFGRFVRQGEGQTDGNGRFTITLPADLLQDADAGSRKVTVEATISDLANFPVASRAGVIFHAAETYVGVVPSDYLATVGAEASVDLLTVDWESQPKGNQDVEVVFYRREWERSRDEEFNIYYTRWQPVDTEVDRVQVTTDADGEAIAAFTPEEGGAYLAVATVTDGDGRQHFSSTTLWAVDSRYAGWRSDPKERRMDLVPDQQEYRPGESAQILVQSPFAGPVRAWLTIERGALIEQRVITLQTGSDVLSLPIRPEYAPNVFVSVTAVKPVTPADAENPYADIRLGIVELVVSPEQLALDVQVTPRADVYSPRETAVFDIQVTDYTGQPVQADVSLSLVDLAVLTLKEDTTPNIVDAFYARQPYRSKVGSGLFVTGEGVEPEVPLPGGGLGGGGGDAGAETALARAAGDEEAGVRQDFRDTAYWQAHVRTGADGQATVEVPLPDNLTTWRMSAKAATTASLVGQTTTDIRVTLPLLLRPVTPRFFTVGDVVQVGAIINNNTGETIEVTASLEAAGLELSSPIEQTVTVPANGRQLVRWEVAVMDVAFADMTFRVDGGGYSDATKPTLGTGPNQTIPVYRYDAEDVVGTSGVLDEAGRRVEAVLLPEGVDLRRGTAEVAMSPSLAAAVLDSLSYLNDERYISACASAVTDRLLPNVATARAIVALDLDRPALGRELDERIRGGIGQLEKLVKADGGWGWCYSDESNPWLTAYTLLALAKADEAGYGVAASVLDSAALYLEEQLQNAADLNRAYEVNRQAFFLYALAEQDIFVDTDVDDLVDEHRALLDPYAKALLALAYELNEVQNDNQKALLADLNDSVILSATGAHWEDASRDFRNLSSDVRGTAIVISALARIAPDTAFAPQAVRWLMVGRTAQHWSTSHETAWSLLALTDWMQETGELEADYPYRLVVNLETEVEGTFTRDNITENETASTPLRDLAPDDVNFFTFERGEGNGRFYYTLHLDSFIAAEQVSAVSRGITVQRVYYDADCDPETETCEPIDRIAAGRQVRVELTIIAPNDLLYAVVRDPIPAGAEAIDPGLETSVSGRGGSTQRTDADYRYGYWGWWYFNRIEYRDEEVRFLAEFLPAGTYQYTYYLQTNIPGAYQVMPTTARESFFPEVFGRADGMSFTIIE